MSSINPGIRILDRKARELGIELREHGVNRRSFRHEDLSYDYTTNGLGHVRMKMYVEPGHTLKQIDSMTILEVEELFAAVAGIA